MPRLPTSILSSIRPRQTPQFLRNSFHSTAINMGVTKQIIKQGDGVNKPKNGDNVTMEYTGWLEENGAKGKQFDSSVGRGDFDVPIGTGRVIKGWDEGIVSTDGGMSLGEKSTLTISSDYGYGPRGFPGAIPGGATLIFDVELKAINGKRA
ncbi:FKBP peptidyl-prolyl cis-trans isomerase, partial [Aureobasidium melanogenum]